MEKAYEGGCVCGAARYRARGKPAVISACHCMFCQRRTGSAFATMAYFDRANVEIMKGLIPADVATFPQGSVGATAQKPFS